MKKVIFFLLIILFSGCAVNTATSTTSNIPSWYLNTPSSNSLYYYGVGEGKTKQSAKLDALAQIASDISTTINAKMNITTQSLKVNNKENFTQEVTQNIQSEVKQIKFSNAKVIKTAYFNNKFVVLVRVDRESLFNQYKLEINDIYANLKKVYNLAKIDIISYLRYKNKFRKLIKQLLAKVALAKSINPTFNAKYYYDSINNMEYSLQKMISNTKIAVIAKNSDAKTYKKVFEKYLSKLGVKIVSNSSFKIIISVASRPKHIQVRDPRLIGVKWADVTINIKVIKNNQLLSTNMIHVINGSKSSYLLAVIKTKKFQRKLQEIGIENILLGK